MSNRATTQDVLSDPQINALSAEQRRELIQRLERPVTEVQSRGFMATLRDAHLGVMAGGAVFMLPWIIYLGFTLPQSYTVRDWPLTEALPSCVAVWPGCSWRSQTPIRA